jgi:cobalt-zinc-cadmium efflux system membrane fusion protein
MVFEKDIHLLKNGQRIDFTVANHPEEELSASIFAIAKEFETRTRAVHIHAKLDQNPGDLIPGMYISGHIHTDSTYTKALPDDALVSEGTKSYIFILDDSVEPEEVEMHGSEGSENHEEPTLPGSSEDVEERHTMAFRRVEVVTGRKDEGFTEIRLLSNLPAHTLVVMNAAYYLLSDMAKEETEHAH